MSVGCVCSHPTFRYHFDRIDMCYIDYTFAPEEWTTDDGARVPQRKLFEDCSFDASTRTFRGTVQWLDSPLGGSARWIYRMVFSDDFCIIEDGEIVSYDVLGVAASTDRYPQDLRYWRHQLPPAALPGCVFMQGGLLGLASYHFPSISGIEGAYISYEAAPPSWLLDNGQPPPPQKAFLNPTFDEESRTFRGTIEWSESAFGGDVRWEYTIVFADSFSHIASGSVRRFNDASGSPAGESVYGVNLNYELYVEPEAQMMHRLSQLRVGLV